MALKLFKKLAPYFCANFKFAHSFLKQLMKADTMDDGMKTESMMDKGMKKEDMGKDTMKKDGMSDGNQTSM